jgi:succinate dehydrogenase flavin-adding protein (antitoxin of CptAB toxin-antitoxin module)
VKIVESFDFKLPRLTEQLSDDDLSKYMALLSNKDAKFAKMLQKLAVWQEKVPRPPLGDQ